ncbi:MAG: response regulator transcription factor [Chloroflexi bacterium]|nr:response regulator transcription factor [Chloroflexota bacterium]
MSSRPSPIATGSVGDDRGTALGPRPRSGTSVALVDSHELVRAGTLAILTNAPLVRVVGEAATASEAVALCRSARPDVVFLDFALPDRAGADAITDIRAVSPRSAVVVLTLDDATETVLSAVRAGARGFILKRAPTVRLIEAIDRILGGQTYVDPEVASRVIEAVAIGANDSVMRTPPALTPRELDVLREVADGRSNKEIAFHLRLAGGTVKIHVERILRKLAAANRAEAVSRAFALGLLEPEAGTGDALATKQR